MHLDVRIPMGLLFSLLGIVLLGYGFFSDPEIYAEHSMGHNVNITWGAVFLVFGIGTLALALRRSASPPDGSD